MSSLVPSHAQTTCDGNTSANSVWRDERRLWNSRGHFSSAQRFSRCARTGSACCSFSSPTCPWRLSGTDCRPRGRHRRERPRKTSEAPRASRRRPGETAPSVRLGFPRPGQCCQQRLRRCIPRRSSHHERLSRGSPDRVANPRGLSAATVADKPSEARLPKAAPSTRGKTSRYIALVAEYPKFRAESLSVIEQSVKNGFNASDERIEKCINTTVLIARDLQMEDQTSKSCSERTILVAKCSGRALRSYRAGDEGGRNSKEKAAEVCFRPGRSFL